MSSPASADLVLVSGGRSLINLELFFVRAFSQVHQDLSLKTYSDQKAKNHKPNKRLSSFKSRTVTLYSCLRSEIHR